MFRISIFREPDGKNINRFSAFTPTLKGSGRTVGEALDALTAQPLEKDSTTAIVQLFHPDRFFPAAKREELSSLMDHWRRLRSINQALPSSEQQKLESLVDEELQAAGERAEDILLEAKKLEPQYRQLKTELQNRYKAETTRLSQLRIATFLSVTLQMAALLSVIFFIWRGSLPMALSAALIGALGTIGNAICIRLQESAHKQTIDLKVSEGNLDRLLLIVESLNCDPEASQYEQRE
jgi:hypothetical protein